MTDTITRCAYCDHAVTEHATVPALDDGDAWATIATEHADDCEWVTTRAHRLDEDDDEDTWPTTPRPSGCAGSTRRTRPDLRAVNTVGRSVV